MCLWYVALKHKETFKDVSAHNGKLTKLITFITTTNPTAKKN